MSKPKEYARVGWSVCDVIEVCPSFTDERADKWLAKHEPELIEAIVECVYDKIEELLTEEGFCVREDRLLTDKDFE